MSRPNVERREAIKAALNANPTLSARQLGKQLGCHHIVVSTQRKCLEKTGEIPRADVVVGGDGKSYARSKLGNERAGTSSKTNAKKTKAPPTLDTRATNALRKLNKGAGSYLNLATSVIGGLIKIAHKDGRAIEELCGTLMEGLVRSATKAGRMDDLAGALHRWAAMQGLSPGLILG